MDNLFIDTNVYLTFYHFSSEELEELKKLSVAVENQNIKLYVTDQVINEFKRNREAKIADALKTFTAQMLPDQFPNMCKSYAEYEKLRESAKEFQKIKEQLIEKLKKDIEAGELGADKIINSLFNVAKLLTCDDNTITKARDRVLLGNPPGKINSYGDSVNWELLLINIFSGEDLHLITDDQDYTSKMYKDKLAEFLEGEWHQKKNSKIFYYRRLSDFFRSKFPHIKLALELEKELAISKFVNSTKFQVTHNAVEKLSKFTDFSDSEVRELIEASITNNQIYWINEDTDVKNFLIDLINGREELIDPITLSQFDNIYRPEQENASTAIDDVPF
jgi:DNA-binding transcriptional regulator YhcF (GntR family)